MDAVLWDDRTSTPISGFGTRGSQLYIKVGLTFTPLHDEIGWSSAVNYMLPGSDAVALWVGVSLKEIQAIVDDKTKLASWTEEQNPLTMLSNLLDVQQTARDNGKVVPTLEYIWQQPGELVISPSGTGHAHFVITVGNYAEQVASNVDSSDRGIEECVDFWSSEPEKYHNSGMVTSALLRDYDIIVGNTEDKFIKKQRI